MTWTLLALFSALALGFYDICKKRALNANAVWLVLFFCGLAGALAMLPFIFLGKAQLTESEHFLTFIKAIIVTSSWACTYNAIKFLPISISSPIRASGPAFTLCLAIAVMGERPELRQWFGILVMLAGYFLLQLAGKKEGVNFRKNKWIAFMVLGTLLGSISSIYDKHLLQTMNMNPLAMQAWFNIYSAVLEGILVLLFWLPKREQEPFRKCWLLIAAVGILLLISDRLYFEAMHQDGAMVSVVSLLRRTSVVVSFFGGIVFMKERKGKTKVLALVAVIAGIVLLLL